MSRGIPRIAPQRHVFVRAEQRAKVAENKGTTVRASKSYRAPKIKGLIARRPGDIEGRTVHSWQVPGGVLKLALVKFTDHKLADEDWRNGRNIEAILMNGVRVRQLRWKSADTNYDARIVGAENATKTPSSTFTFLAQKYELFYRHNPLYGPNRLGRCDFVVGTDEYGHKKINLYFRFKGLDRYIPKICKSGIKSRLYDHRRWEIHGLDGARGPQPPSYYVALQKREEKRWVEEQYAELAKLKAERDKWEQCRDKDGFLFYRLRENGYKTYDEPDEHKQVKSQEEVLGLREEEERKRILERKLRLKEERDRIAAEREAKDREAHPEWYQVVSKTRALGEQDLFVLNARQEAALAAKEAAEKARKDKADREDPDQAFGDPMRWRYRAVDKWMAASKVAMYAPVFREAEVTGAQLVAMQEPEMEAIGVANHVHRVIIMRMAKKLHADWRKHLANMQAQHSALIRAAVDIVDVLADMATRCRQAQALAAASRVEESADKSADEPDKPADKSADEPDKPADKSADEPDKPADKSADEPDKSSDKSADEPDKPKDKSANTPDKPADKSAEEPDKSSDKSADDPDKSDEAEPQFDYHAFVPVMKQLREAIDREGKFRITAEFEGVQSRDLEPPAQETLSGLDRYNFAMEVFDELKRGYEAEQKRIQEQDNEERLLRQAVSRLKRALNAIYKNASDDAKNPGGNYYRHVHLLETLKKALAVKLVTDDLAVIQEARLQLEDFEPHGESEILELPPKKTLSVDGWGWISAQWMAKVGTHLFKSIDIVGEAEEPLDPDAFPGEYEALMVETDPTSPKFKKLSPDQRRSSLLQRHNAMRQAAALAAQAFILNDDLLEPDSEEEPPTPASDPVLSDDPVWLKKVKKLFNKIDKDGSGSLGLSEIRRFIRKTNEKTPKSDKRKQSSLVIKNKDVVLTTREKMRAKQKEEQAQKARRREREESSQAFMQLFDSDGDGSVALDEFIKVFDAADIDYAQRSIDEGLRFFREQHDAKKKKRHHRVTLRGRH